jgi:PadR family transcriptional regulator PadR
VAKGEFLGEFEQLVLIALLRLGDEAYGMAVRREIEARADRDVSIGAVYAKKCFTITGAGARALDKSQQALRQMLDGLPARWNPAR